jgi:cation diffusion facilitator CzcD-associated flavoprotein CzcO
MVALPAVAGKARTETGTDFDAIVIGAGVSGLYQLYRLAGAISTRFLITAIGVLSAPTMPRISGVDSFRGQSCHTHYWPEAGVEFAGKRVAVIGTGATGVQTITEVAKTVGHLSVFQRTPRQLRSYRHP